MTLSTVSELQLAASTASRDGAAALTMVMAPPATQTDDDERVEGRVVVTLRLEGSAGLLVEANPGFDERAVVRAAIRCLARRLARSM